MQKNGLEGSKTIQNSPEYTGGFWRFLEECYLKVPEGMGVRYIGMNGTLPVCSIFQCCTEVPQCNIFLSILRVACTLRLPPSTILLLSPRRLCVCALLRTLLPIARQDRTIDAATCRCRDESTRETTPRQGCRFSLGKVSGILRRHAVCRLALHEESHRLRVAHKKLLVKTCRISPIRE